MNKYDDVDILRYSENTNNHEEEYAKKIGCKINEKEIRILNNNNLKDKIWYIGDYDDGYYIKNLDGRNS